MTNHASPGEISASADGISDAIFPGGEALSLDSAKTPDSLGPLVMRVDQEPTTDRIAEPSIEQLVAEGNLQDGEQAATTPVLYEQPPSTVAGVFEAGLKKAMLEGADDLSKSEIASASTFSAIKAMAKVFAETMREKAIPPLYGETPIEPKAPNAMQRALHITPTSPGIVRTPYWIVLSDRDLSWRNMKPWATDSLGRVKKDFTTWSYSERAVGVTADGVLVRLIREYNEQVIAPPDFTLDNTAQVEPNDLFDTTKVDLVWPTGDPAIIINTFEKSLAERAVNNLRLKGAATHGYDAETVLNKQPRKRA